MTRIALGVEYDGSEFHGFQLQQNVLSIQACLQQSLSKIADEPITIYCAGRTDAKVHATYQVIHFDTEAERPLSAWIQGTNTYLPKSIAVKWAAPVDNTFHARFSALARRYRYVIYQNSTRSAIWANRATQYPYALDIHLMNEASKYLIGENDFSSFRSAECESLTPMRNVSEISISRCDDFVIIEIEANAFLHHMVRNIVGALFRIGSQLEKPEWMQTLLHAKNRRAGAETAKPDGLYLIDVKYPDIYLFPKQKENHVFHHHSK